MFRRRDEFYNRFQNFRNSGSLLCGNGDRLFPRNGENLLHLLQTHIHVRCGKVDFVNDRDDMQIMLHRQIHVGDRLRLNPLRGVDHKQCTVARGKRTADLVSKVHMPRSVDQIEFVFNVVGGGVQHPNRMRLDGDPALLLQIHGVQQLIVGQIAFLNGSGCFKESVGKRGFPMVDMGNDRKISD